MKRSFKPLIDHESQRHGRVTKQALAMANAVLERALALHRIHEKYREIPACDDPFEFVSNALKVLRTRYVVGEGDIDAIPRTGPVIVVANHPFGGLDGMILADVLASVRKDLKILVNYYLNDIVEMRPIFLPVDPFGGKDAARKNLASLRSATRWVREGNLLVVFPAGEVAHMSWKNPTVTDAPWSDTVARLVRMTKAPVLPVYFDGRNSLFFHLAGLVHPLARTALLPREMLKKAGSLIRVRVGSLLRHENLGSFEDPSDLVEYLRFRTHLLGVPLRHSKRRIRIPDVSRIRPRKRVAILPPKEARILADEVRWLPAHQKLLDAKEFSVYYARANQIPSILQEIGRLREETFRAAGEGTGNAIDLDRFDHIYIHLFVWNTEEKEVVGAYRLGPTDEILPRYGKKGLYTQTLFRYQRQLLEEMGPALEMGRTFVTGKYQKSFSPLMLLWRGIGQYVVLHPYYKVLFGAVSISNDYRSYSRQLMVAFLKINNFAEDLSRLVKPRKPFRHKNVIGLNHERTRRWGDDLDELSSWVSGLEEDRKGVPILLKQYIKLGGKLLSFNVDPKFGSALDGLIVVNLTRTSERVLKRYMGAEGFERFLQYHSETGARLIVSS